jgi:hypothetical protein
MYQKLLENKNKTIFNVVVGNDFNAEIKWRSKECYNEKKKFLLFIDKQGQKPLAKLTKQEKTKINSEMIKWILKETPMKEGHIKIF